MDAMWQAFVAGLDFSPRTIAHGLLIAALALWCLQLRRRIKTLEASNRAVWSTLSYRTRWPSSMRTQMARAAEPIQEGQAVHFSTQGDPRVREDHADVRVSAAGRDLGDKMFDGAGVPPTDMERLGARIAVETGDGGMPIFDYAPEDEKQDIRFDTLRPESGLAHKGEGK